MSALWGKRLLNRLAHDAQHVSNRRGPDDQTLEAKYAASNGGGHGQMRGGDAMPTMSQIIARAIEAKLEILTTVHGHLESGHAALTLEHSALALRQDELSARIGNLERTVAAASASSQGPAVLAERAVKLEGIERELADNQRCLQTASDQLSASRVEIYAKEKRLQELEQHQVRA